MKVSAIIQARTGSTRLPGKVIKKICGRTVLEHVITRAKQCKNIDNIIIATTLKAEDDIIVQIANQENVDVFRGEEQDVLDRYFQAAKAYKADIVVRITSDDPLLDYRLVDEIVTLLITENADYCCNNIPPSYPYGLDCECFRFSSLEKAWLEAERPYEREHVTPYIRENKDIFKILSIQNDMDYSFLRWTLDTQEDYEYISDIYEALYFSKTNFATEDVIEYLKKAGRLRERA